MGTNLWKSALWVAGLYLLAMGIATLTAPETIGALFGVERVASTTSMRMVAGNAAIIGALILSIAARGGGDGAFISVAALACAGTSAVLFHAAETVIGSPPDQVAGERLEGAIYAVLALVLIFARFAGVEALGGLFASRARAVAGPRWLAIVAQIIVALLGLMMIASGLRGLLSPAENAVSGGIPYGLLWSVTLARLVGLGFAVFGLGLVYAAFKPRGARTILLGMALIFTKNIFVMAYGALTIAMPIAVYSASMTGAVAFAVMSVVAWLLWLVLRRTKAT